MDFYDYDSINVCVPAFLWDNGKFEMINKYSEHAFIKSNQENYIEVEVNYFDGESLSLSELIFIEDDN